VISRVPISPLSRTRLTPSLTTRNAIDVEPESVSSRIAIFGFSSSSCRIRVAERNVNEASRVAKRSARILQLER